MADISFLSSVVFLVFVFRVFWAIRRHLTLQKFSDGGSQYPIQDSDLDVEDIYDEKLVCKYSQKS